MQAALRRLTNSCPNSSAFTQPKHTCTAVAGLHKCARDVLFRNGRRPRRGCAERGGHDGGTGALFHPAAATQTARTARHWCAVAAYAAAGRAGAGPAGSRGGRAGAGERPIATVGCGCGCDRRQTEETPTSEWAAAEPSWECIPYYSSSTGFLGMVGCTRLVYTERGQPASAISSVSQPGWPDRSTERLAGWRARSLDAHSDIHADVCFR